MPVSGGNPARGGEEVAAAAATLAAPAAPFNRGVAGDRAYVCSSTSEPRLCSLQRWRRPVPPAAATLGAFRPPGRSTVEIGTFLPKSGRSPLVGSRRHVQLGAAGRRGVGRPAGIQARRVAGGIGGRPAVDGHAPQRRPLSHRRRQSRRRSCAICWRRRSPPLPEIAGIVALDERRLQFSPAQARRRSSPKT